MAASTNKQKIECLHSWNSTIEKPKKKVKPREEDYYYDRPNYASN